MNVRRTPKENHIKVAVAAFVLAGVALLPSQAAAFRRKAPIPTKKDVKAALRGHERRLDAAIERRFDGKMQRTSLIHVGKISTGFTKASQGRVPKATVDVHIGFARLREAGWAASSWSVPTVTEKFTFVQRGGTWQLIDLKGPGASRKQAAATSTAPEQTKTDSALPPLSPAERKLQFRSFWQLPEMPPRVKGILERIAVGLGRSTNKRTREKVTTSP